MVRRQTWQAQRFKIFESARHFRIESNWDIRFESNLEASQVPRCKVLYIRKDDTKLSVWLCSLKFTDRDDDDTTNDSYRSKQENHSPRGSKTRSTW